MIKIEQKYIIKVPRSIGVYFCKKKNIIIIKGPSTKKILKLNVKILISEREKKIYVTSILTKKTNLKTSKIIQGTTAAIIKQRFFESLTTLYSKLNFIGVGYKAFSVEDYENILLMLKLGFSHNIFFKIPGSIKISRLKLTKLFIFSNSYLNVTQIASILRKNKIPEPYKGKGILYDGEKIKLKEGKKI